MDIELNEMMKHCLIEANNDYPDLDYADTVIQAFRDYVTIIGEPVQVESDEEGEELFNKAVVFLIDCVLFNLIEKGLVEVAGIEDGEFVYQLTAEF